MSKAILFVLLLFMSVGCRQAPPTDSPSPPATVSPAPEPGTAQDQPSTTGRRLFERTYEKLPGVKSKLHCASCHLQSGTAMGAAPLVNLNDYYQEEELIARVNSCLTNNMNGAPLSHDNAEMQALLAYLQSLQQEQAPPRGLATVEAPAQQPDPGRGQGLYNEKCSSCHKSDGSGTYPQGKYQYPALWGEHSFTAQSDLNDPESLAAFITVKMPLGQGTTLSNQEAWDIAAYVTGRERPRPAVSSEPE